MDHVSHLERVCFRFFQVWTPSLNVIMITITRQSIKCRDNWMTISFNSPRFLDWDTFFVDDSDHASIKCHWNKLMFIAKLFNSLKLPINTVCWPFDSDHWTEMSYKVEKIDHWWPNLLKNMSMVFNFQFGWFMLQVHIWPCCATSAWNTDPNQNWTMLNCWTAYGVRNFVSNVHSVWSGCNVFVFRTSDDIAIFRKLSCAITKLGIRSTTKFNEYPAVWCHWRACRFPCALLRTRRYWRYRFPCAGFRLLWLLPGCRLWRNTH